MKLNKEISGKINIITIEEREANLSNSENFKEQLIADIAAGQTHFIVSFAKVNYIDSSFLGALVAILKALLPVSGKLVLTGMNDDILNLFQLTRLDKIFILKEDIETAMKEF